MKHLLTILLTLAATTLFAQTSNTNSLWDEANTAYVNGNYSEAILLYDSIAGTGTTSSKLLYNLGNAHYKAGNLGRAILNYRRALRLAPNDSDIRYNLSVADSHTKDKIETLPQWALGAWLNSWRNHLTANEWGVISLTSLALALAGTLVYLLSRKTRRRKLGFSAIVLFGIVTLLSLWFAIAEQRRTAKKEGVILATAASVSSSPEGNGRELFVLHEGTVVEISGNYGTWIEVILSDGNKGWMQHSAIEEI